MGDAMTTMILGGLSPQEALGRNRLDLLARLRGDVVAEIVTQRSPSGYFMSAEDEAAAHRTAPAAAEQGASAAS